MTTTSFKPTESFIKNIESAIKDHGTITCPNLECDKKLISKKKMNSEGKSFMEYHCTNESCHFHLKRSFEIENETLPKQKLKITNNHLLLLLGCFLFCILSYSSYKLFYVNQFIENEVAKSKMEKVKTEKAVSTTSKRTGENFNYSPD